MMQEDAERCRRIQKDAERCWRMQKDVGGCRKLQGVVSLKMIETALPG